jgi:flap endonuclease-1
MGNSALRQLAALEEQKLTENAGQTVAVDAHHWLHRYMAGLTRYADPDIYEMEDGTELVNLLALFRGLPPLLRHSITPIFVFDGDPHERKEETIQSRKDAKKKAEKKMKEAAERGDLEEMRRYRSQAQSLTPAVHESTRGMLERLGIPFIEAGGSGEAYAARLVAEGSADAVLTDDYDSLLFGAPLTLRQYSGDGPAEAMRLEQTLEQHGIDREELIDIAILCGTDFNDGVSGIGPKRGVKKISNGMTVEDILCEREAEINGLEELRSLFLNPDLNALPSSQPERSDPDFSAVKSYAHEWEIPGSYISDNLKRFPEY